MPPRRSPNAAVSLALVAATLLPALRAISGRAQEAAEDVVPLPALATAVSLESGPVPVALRVSWGGGRPRRWRGTIRILDAPPGTLDWNPVAAAADATTRFHAEGASLEFRQAEETASEEAELRVVDDPAARLAVRLVPDDHEEEAIEAVFTIGEVIRGQRGVPLDSDANRLTVRRAPGDELRVSVDGGTVRLPGETVRLRLHPLLPPREGGIKSHELRVRVRQGAEGDETHSHTWLLHESAPRPEDDSPPPQRFEPIAVEVPLPAHEGVYDVVLEITERGGLRWARPSASRTVQVVAVPATGSRGPAAEEEWRVVHELDPTSPKLLERLRRLPVVGRGAAALPQVPLPTLPIPKVPLPQVPLPKFPGVAAVGAVVPRLSGLLATGHSTLESHPAGALFRLPPSRTDGEPTWEAIQLSGVVPGIPHRLEIDLPESDRAVLSLVVLEEVGGSVLATYHGGVSVEAVPGSSALLRHACTFRPQSRAPLVVIGNPSPRQSVSFGAVRILAGPARLSPASGPARPGARSVWGVVDDPRLAGFGGPWRVDPTSGRASTDWQTVLVAARGSAEWFASRGAAGALVTVHADGASAWPARGAATRRVDSATADPVLDPVPKDVVEVLCRVYRRHGLSLVPAIRCSGILPALEDALGAGAQAAPGILCVGRDGRPSRGDPTRDPRHYNILDPRVQAAVESLVGDLADRVAVHDAVDGLALEIPHEGWFHLPGAASCLDDVTFARFLGDDPAAAAIVAGAGPEAARADEARFALRAALVEGPLREAWLEWRAARVAGFVGRLADRVAAARPGRTLSIVPTTLFTAGDLAARFRPVLAADGPPNDLPREIGLDPVRLTEHPGVVWVSPHANVPSDDVMQRETARMANNPDPRAAGAVRRRAAIAVESAAGFDVAPVLAQGVFSSSASSDLVRFHPVRAGIARQRAFAEILAAGDCERIYDGGLAWRAPDDADRGLWQVLAGLPAGRLETVSGVPAPLVVRSGRQGDSAALVVTNASAVRVRARVETSVADPAGAATVVDLPPWETRSIPGVGPATLRGVRAEFDVGLAERVRADLDRLRRRRAALEMPAPLQAIDNPGFEIAGLAGDVPGWELLEASRGRLRLVPGGADGTGRALAFGSDHGLATLRSNPFPAPATGRVSVAMWLRVDPGEAVPPLRIAVEGVQGGREYYRFAPVGDGPQGRRLDERWTQVVLQVDDLPTSGLDSLRVRLDLLAGGAVQVDDVRVFDLAFDEGQRVRLSKSLALAEHHLASGDLGACVTALDGHWARFLDSFVSDEAAERAARARIAAAPAAAAAETASPAPDAAPRAGTGILDRVRRLWK